MGKLTISMAIFNSYVKLPEGILDLSLPHLQIFIHSGTGNGTEVPGGALSAGG